VYLITALMICYEATIALFRRFAGEPHEPTSRFDAFRQRAKRLLGVAGRRVPVPSQPVPRATFIVAAFLPHEQDIIVDTLTHILDEVRRPEAGLEVILAYNTPIELPIEAELRQLAERRPELRILHVADSESKAENLNAAIAIATGEIVGILDADHYPPADCF